MTAGIGHNRPPETFDDVVKEAVDYGILLRIKEVIVEASRDPRLERRHLRVLAEVVACINCKTGIAYPGRATISANTRKWNPTDDGDEEFGYTDAGVSKTLSELVTWGYLVTMRRALEKGGRALTLYGIRKPPQEDLADHITQWIMAQRLSARPKRNWRLLGATASTPVGNSTPVGVSTDVGKPTHVGGVRQADSQKLGHSEQRHTTGSDLVAAVPTYAGNSTHVDSSGSDSTSDSTYVDRTVTVGGTSVRTDNSAGAQAHEKYLPPNHGEVHRGFGVYLNCDQIRHANFSINLEGVRMNTVNSGLSSNEVVEICLGHALQWATEIENGSSPHKVLPSKIVNFLARSVMGDINQRRIHQVRESRASQPYAARAGNSNGTPVESETDRTKRMIAEAIDGKR